MRKYIKHIWKSMMYFVIKMYLKDSNIHIINEVENLPKDQVTYSQFGQDTYVFNNLFNQRKNGVFVDVGANDPVKCSNTYLFETNGWTGLAIEPQDTLRDLWPKTRKTICIDNVIGPETKDITFVEGDESEHGLAGIKGFNKVSENNQKEIIKKQRRLDEILIERNITKVDYLSIDVEGYEMSVLESIDFSKVYIQVIGIENDLGFEHLPFIGKKLASELGNKKIREFIISKGYKQVGRIMCDDFFIKNK
jgi:FkbM family methyltransferase